MKRVLHISKRFPPYIGGIESVCCDVCHALEGKYEQIVIAYNDKNETIDEIYQGIHVIRVGVTKVIASQPIAPSYNKVLYKLMKEFRPDIIHFQYPNPYAAFFLLKAIKKFHYTGKFLLQWNCDIIKQKVLGKLFDSQNKKLLKMADIVATITPTYIKDTSYLPYFNKHYETLQCRVGDDRLVITEPEKSKAVDIRKKYNKKVLCFFFGRHVEYKGLKYLIDSNQYLDQDKIQIIIGGSGPLTEDLKKQASKYSNIDFVGRLSNEDINSYLMACDIFTFPSITRNEAFGISLAESMYFSKPAVTFTIKGSGVNWVSINEKTCIECPNRDAKKYAKAITTLANNKELRDKMGENAKKRCEELFTLDVFNTNVREIYKKLEDNSHKEI
jgi:rhamnosyl/mannosyltransferase